MNNRTCHPSDVIHCGKEITKGGALAVGGVTSGGGENPSKNRRELNPIVIKPRLYKMVMKTDQTKRTV